MAELTPANTVRFLPNGELSVCLSFPQEHNWPLQSLAATIREQIPSVIEIIPAYESITLVFDQPVTELQNLHDDLRDILNQDIKPTTSDVLIHKIPVCYHPEVAPDLRAVCEKLNLSIAELIQRHTSQNYPVAMFGFQPGFIYLAGLSDDLSVPRKATPALQVPSGAVAIGGDQTGIYSLSSPGGWWVVGRTPEVLFNAAQTPPISIEADDVVRFHAISLEQYLEASHAD